MAGSVEKRGKIRVSKNRKRNWNKYCKIDDVEEFLEEQRRDERLGGPVSEKPDDELFIISTEQDDERLEPKKLKGVLKCHYNLQSFSSVPTPVKPLKGEKHKSDDDDLPKSFKKKKLSKLPVQKTKKKASQAVPEFHDLWAEDTEKKVDPELAELIAYGDELMKKRPVKVPSHRFQKPSLLPPVEVPKAGASYNPSYIDHQKLLAEAVVIEEKKLKEELHLKRVLTDMFPTKAEAPTEKTYLEEMSQGLFEEENEDQEDESPALTANPPVSRENKKSRSQKRKKLELKIRERERQKEKQNKKEMNEVFRLRSIAAEIKKAEEITKERIEKRRQIEIGKMYKPRTLGQYKYEPNDLEVNLSDELRGSLRILKTEGNILEDRYKSLQRRNIIEPRIRQKRKRKYKLKVQVKRSHRNFK